MLRAAPGAAAPAQRLNSSEELLQFDRRLGLELCQRALRWRLIGPPPHEADAVAEAIILQSIEGDLTDELWTERLPVEVAAL